MKSILMSFAAGLLILGVGGVNVARAQSGQPYPDQYPNGMGQQDPNMPPPPQQSPNAPLPPQGQAAPSQPPGQIQPGVGRLSFIHGDVSQQRGDNGQWVASTLNTPIEPGDRVTTGQDARAELQLDYANILRMSNNVTANVVTLTRTNIQIQVGQGLTAYSVLKGSEAQSEIDTPNAAVRPLGEGNFRVLVNSNAETQVIVRNGSAEISTPQGTTRIDKGQMITVAGTDSPQYKTDPAPGKDEWDSWNSDRDKRVASAESWRNTDRYYTGTEDLDQNGTWSEIPDYGPVWSPREDAGWAPYRAGRWVYEPYYGWTWVSYEPWGWAPYHYGRWFVYGGSWVWWPGPVRAYPGYYPVWAPAYVSFFGFGGGGWGLSFGIGFGGWGRIGWLPSGPGDWYHPWYGGWGARYSGAGVNEFGRFHEGFSPLGRGERFSNFNGALRDDRIRSGFSSMGGNEFGRGAVSMRQEGISEASLRQASAMTGRMPVNPSPESFRPSNRAPSPSTIRDGSAGPQSFFSSNRAGFAAGAGGRGDVGLGGHRAGESLERPSSAATRTSRGNVGGGAQQEWHTFNPPGHGGSQPQSSVRSFDTPNGSQHGFNSPNSSPNTASRGSYGGSFNSYNRPPLNMRQPIVTPRGGYNESARGGSSGGGYSAPRGNYSAPRGGSSGGGSRGSGGGSRSGGGSHSGHSR
jgi:hypothetical protein